MRPYPSVEDLLRPVLRVAMPWVRSRRGGAHGSGGWSRPTIEEESHSCQAG